MARICCAENIFIEGSWGNFYFTLSLLVQFRGRVQIMAPPAQAKFNLCVQCSPHPFSSSFSAVGRPKGQHGYIRVLTLLAMGDSSGDGSLSTIAVYQQKLADEQPLPEQ